MRFAMITILKMAYRDLGRNRRRSFFSALALGIGLGLLLLMAAFIAGEIRGSMTTSIRLQSGHLQVRAKTYNEAKTSLVWEDLLADPASMAAQIGKLAPVKAATPRLYASGIVNSGDESQGVRIVGIEPASAANAPFQEGLTGGEFLKAGDGSGILIGLTLAERLGLKPGDSIELLANTSNGGVDQQAFTIRGVFSTRTPGYDNSTVFLPLEKAQSLTKT